MKVVCISTNGDPWAYGGVSKFIVGETYEIIRYCYNGDGEEFYDIKTKGGSICWIPSKNFITIEKHRELQIDKILI